MLKRILESLLRSKKTRLRPLKSLFRQERSLPTTDARLANYFCPAFLLAYFIRSDVNRSFCMNNARFDGRSAFAIGVS